MQQILAFWQLLVDEEIIATIAIIEWGVTRIISLGTIGLPLDDSAPTSAHPLPCPSTPGFWPGLSPACRPSGKPACPLEVSLRLSGNRSGLGPASLAPNRPGRQGYIS